MIIVVIGIPIIVIFAVTGIIAYIVGYIAINSNTTYHNNMTGEEFEIMCANLLRKNGFSNVSTTSRTGDHGIDIIAYKDGYKYAIQCKNYANKVGNKAVQEAYSGKAIYNANIAVVMTNNQFTPQAIEDANRLNVWLWDGIKIFQFQNAIKKKKKDEN